MFGRSNNIGIGLEIYLDDKFSKAATNLAKNLLKTGHDVDKFGERFENLENMGQGLKNVGDVVTGFVVDSVKAFAEYEDIMNSVKVIAQETDQIKFEKLKSQTLALANEFGILPTAIGKAQLELAKSGKKNEEILNMTRAVMALGAATDTAVDGVNGTAEVLVNVMNAYGAASDQADYFAAAITSAANQSTIDVKDFFQSFRYSGDVAKNLGVSMHEISAILATLGNAGIKGSIAGTSYANMLRYLATSVGQFGNQRQKKALEVLGAAPTDFVTATGEMKNMGEILDVIRSKMVNLTQTEAFSAIEAIFGVRGNRAATPLLKGIVEGKMDMKAYETMYDLVGEDIKNQVHIQQAKDMLDDTLGDWKKFRTEFVNMMIQLGSIFGPSVRKYLQIVREAVHATTEWLKHPWIQKVVSFVGTTGVMTALIGRLILAVVSMGRFLLTFSNNFSNALKTYTATTASIKSQFLPSTTGLKQAANTMLLAAEKNLLAARGLYKGATPGMVYGPGLGPTAKYTGMRTNRFARWIGGLFGIAAMRRAMRFTTWLGKAGGWFIKMAPWLGKLGNLFSKIFMIGGRLVKGFFGWWGIFAELIVQAITGKGILEWLWIGFQNLGGMLEGVIWALDKLIGVIDLIWNFAVNLIKGVVTAVKGSLQYLIFDYEGGDKSFDESADAFSKAFGGIVETLTPSSPGMQGSDYLPKGKLEGDIKLNPVKSTPTQPTTLPMMFEGGRLVPQTNWSAPSETAAIEKTTNNVKNTVIKQKPVNVNLTVQAPESGEYTEQFSFGDDELLGAGLYE